MEQLRTDPQAMVFLRMRERDRTLYYFGKRVIDVSLVLLSLFILLPVMLIIALLVKLDSPGPALFIQKRVGARRRFNGHSYYWEPFHFNILKFRTMKVDASSSLHYEFMKAYISGDEETLAKLRAKRKKEKAKYKLANDPRVTRIGGFLRKSSLDELPQLFNVLMGHMSLVGPRPPIPYEVEMYKPWHNQRLETMQGITGLWQVEGRSATTFDDMVKMDLKYIEYQSLWLDIKLLFMTIPAAIVGKGAR